MRAGVVKMIGGHSSSSTAPLLAMMVVMMTMFITTSDCFSFEQNISVVSSSSTWCDGLDDDLSCLIGQTDLDSDEFMLDSGFSRRILVGPNQDYSDKTKDRAKSVACDRSGFPPCLPSGGNSKPPQVDCVKAPTNRECYRYKKN